MFKFRFCMRKSDRRVLRKCFLSRIAALRGDKKMKSGSFMDGLQRKI